MAEGHTLSVTPTDNFAAVSMIQSGTNELLGLIDDAHARLKPYEGDVAGAYANDIRALFLATRKVAAEWGDAMIAASKNLGNVTDNFTAADNHAANLIG